MSKTKYDVTKVSRETLEKLAQRVLDAYQNPGVRAVTFTFGDPNTDRNYLVRDVVVEAKVHLRTKAEVDAELSAYVRSFHKEEDNDHYHPPYDRGDFVKKVEELVTEETAD